MIRTATMDDIPELMRMGMEFFKVAELDKIGEFDFLGGMSILETIIPNGTCLIGDTCAIGYYLAPLPMVKDVVIANELFWWVDPTARNGRDGIRLLAEAEKRAKLQGAHSMIMISLNVSDGEKVSNFLQRKGYTPTESHLMKEL